MYLLQIYSINKGDFWRSRLLILYFILIHSIILISLAGIHWWLFPFAISHLCKTLHSENLKIYASLILGRGLILLEDCLKSIFNQYLVIEDWLKYGLENILAFLFLSSWQFYRFHLCKRKIAPMFWYRDREIHLVDSLACSLLLDNRRRAHRGDNFQGRAAIIFLIPWHT